MANPASSVPKDKHPTAEQLYDEVAWMGAKLIETRASIADAPLVVTYLDTNGNERQKTNPVFDAYESLFNAFLRGAQALDRILDEAEPEQAEAKMTLADLRVMVNRKASGQ